MFLLLSSAFSACSPCTGGEVTPGLGLPSEVHRVTDALGSLQELRA